jgi:hypothetical protein
VRCSARLLSLPIVVTASISWAGEAPPDTLDIQPAEVRQLRSVPIAGRSGYFSWESAVCDEHGQVFLLPISPRTGEGQEPSPPRDVLRISSDGKELKWFDPTSAHEFADADEVTTIALTLDTRGDLVTLIWARWIREGGEFGEKGGQYIVSFDDDGPHSHQEVDWREMKVGQFAVFGSGDYLLRGLRLPATRERLVILPRGAKEFRDIVGWPNYPAQWDDDPNRDVGRTFFSRHTVRGGDGQVYLTGLDPQEDVVRVYSLDPSDGRTREAFRLEEMPHNYQLLGLLSAGRRLAALYGEPPRPDAEQRRTRYWADVYANIGTYERQRVYGPLPRLPMCFEHSDTGGDRFTSIEVGQEGQHFLTTVSRKE